MIKRKKGDICPICEQRIVGKNYWVKYHIRYRPPLVILGCRFCNYTEWAIRNNKIVRCANPNRVYRVLSLQKKFDIIM